MKKKIAASFISAITSVSAATAFAMSAFAEEAASGEAAPASANPIFTLVLPLGIMFVLLYFMAIKPQKKREQEQKTMQESLRVGDEIVTTGGIVGMIVRVGDDNVVIETGGERNKLRIKKWAIAENVSAAERMKSAAPKKSALATSAVTEEKDEKKSKKSKKAESTEDEE